VLAYDDVLNIQRQSVYGRRRELLTGSDEAVDAELEFAVAGDEEKMKAIAERKAMSGNAFYPNVRRMLLQGIDFLWVEHLEAMEYLRSSVNLRAYGNRDPLVEYKKEGLKLFQAMEDSYRAQVEGVVANLVQISEAVQNPSAAVRVIHTAAASITASAHPSEKHEYERNEKVLHNYSIHMILLKYLSIYLCS
jgi:preprotein translocase subunit SecA